ncbi:gp38 [Alphaproteobacteria phage PhiJL001]|uniref:Gp38 n=1 Tax=Alphaproteobacteria phage PhiJL001 TaxID=2681607 RepID=Q5DN67_9CAUD|nr:gp38 [Alphaproteobacteria phage PhiJL001]AAT69514.1 gp38 [Alphaproteobacteria phage PhiJL001]
MTFWRAAAIGVVIAAGYMVGQVIVMLGSC